jgi:hypothetical protein
MRIWSFLLPSLLLVIGCTFRRPKPSVPNMHVAHRPTPCSLLSVPYPVEPAFEDTKHALHEFNTQPGNPYALLYIEKTSGHPDRDRCVRILQRTEKNFTVYTYTSGKRDSVQFSSLEGQELLTKVQPGHFTTSCQGFVSLSTICVLQLKQGQAIPFSCSIDSQRWSNLSEADIARLQPAFTFLRLLQTK